LLTDYRLRTHLLRNLFFNKKNWNSKIKILRELANAFVLKYTEFL